MHAIAEMSAQFLHTYINLIHSERSHYDQHHNAQMSTVQMNEIMSNRAPYTRELSVHMLRNMVRVRESLGRQVPYRQGERVAHPEGTGEAVLRA